MLIKQAYLKSAVKSLVVNKENKKIQKSVKFDEKYDDKQMSWLVPSLESLTKILSPFRLNSSQNIENSCFDTIKKIEELPSSVLSDDF